MQSDAAHPPGAGPDLPELLPPASERPRAAMFAGLGMVAIAVAAVWLLPSRNESASEPPPPATIALDVNAYPVRFNTLPWTDLPGPLRAALLLTEAEKRELEAQLTAGTAAVGVITLWDNVDEDGDTIQVEGAGFTQTFTILHTPKSFYVPYRPGTTIRVTAIRDGGGGVTLGAAGLFGDLGLPRLAPGQALEIPVL